VSVHLQWAFFHRADRDDHRRIPGPCGAITLLIAPHVRRMDELGGNQMSDVYVSKSDRINPNLIAAGGDLIVGDSAPGDHGDRPGEPVRVNANAQGAAQAPGASAVAIADKAVTADDLRELAQKAGDRGDQQGSLALLAAEKSMRAGDVAKTSATRVAHSMARQAARFLKRQQTAAIENTAPPSNVNAINLLRTACADENWGLVEALATKMGKRASGNPALTSLCANLAHIAKSRKG
jgi:hypothetical protein